MAGRNFSGDQLALSSARVSTCSTMMGQTAGINAALAVEKKTTLRNLNRYHIRMIITKRGANLDV